MPRILAIILLITLFPFPAIGAQKPARPYTGIGILFIRPFTPERSDEIATVRLYNQPSVERVLEMETSKLPNLSTVLKAPVNEYSLAVMNKKGGWLKIAYDEAGREGWLYWKKYWGYLTWDSYLKGRAATMLGGLANDYYQLRKEASPNAQPVATLSKQSSLRIIEVQGDWAMVIVDVTLSGWLRWRDGDGRFLFRIN